MLLIEDNVSMLHCLSLSRALFSPTIVGWRRKKFNSTYCYYLRKGKVCVLSIPNEKGTRAKLLCSAGLLRATGISETLSRLCVPLWIQYSTTPNAHVRRGQFTANGSRLIESTYVHFTAEIGVSTFMLLYLRDRCLQRWNIYVTQ